jgi:hypothetical protein
MPPRRSARVTDAAERATSALSPLPHSVVLHIFSLLPVDARLRCLEVCRGWRAVLLERSLWTRLNLSATCGATSRVTLGLLRAAAARAGGQLAALDVFDRDFFEEDEESEDDGAVEEALLEVVTANSAALRELRLGFADGVRTFLFHDVQQLLRAASQLRVAESGVACEEVADALRVLRNADVFAPLRVRFFVLDASETVMPEQAALLATADAVASHAWLTELGLFSTPLDEAATLDAFVDAALTRQLVHVSLHGCSLSPASVPALVRLMAGGVLRNLNVHNDGEQLFDEATAALMANAIRTNTTLTSVTFSFMQQWRIRAAATLLIGALTAHPSVREVRFEHARSYAEIGLPEPDRAAIGAALGALVAADAPALTQLSLALCDLGDEGLRALMEALPRNTHLRTLDVRYNEVTEAFARDVLLPAVRANTSLQRLHVGGDFAAMSAAQRHVARRAAGA